MKISKKYFYASMLAITATCFATSAMATRRWVTGYPLVTAVYSNSAGLDSFDLVGIGTPVGSCPLDSNGDVLATINKPGMVGAIDPSGDRLWALVLAAEVAHKKVKVFLDDSVTDANGQCLAIAILMKQG